MKTLWFALGIFMLWVTIILTWEVDKAWEAYSISQSAVDLHTMYYHMFNVGISAGFLAMCLYLSSDRAIYVEISNHYEETSPDRA